MKDGITFDDRHDLMNKPYLHYGVVTTAVAYAAGVDSAATVILVNGAITVTLPLAADSKGRVYTIKKIDAGAASTIAASGGDLIDGAVSQSLPDQYDVMQVVCNGLAWYVLGFTNL